MANGVEFVMTARPRKSRKALMRRGLILCAVATGFLLLAGCSSTGKSSGGGSTTAKPRASTSVSHNIGSKDASADVTVGAVTVDSTLGLPSAPVTVVNHSSKRSHYLITIALESADGKTQIDSTIVAVNDLDPGQSAKETAQFATTEKLPTGAKAVLKSVDRIAA